MPTIECSTVLAPEVKVGDLIDNVLPTLMIVSGKRIVEGGDGRMVEAIKRGDKIVHFTTTGGNISVRVNADVNIRREVPTAEEAAAKEAETKAAMAAYVEDEIRKAIAAAHANVEKSTADMVKAAAYSIDSQWSYLGTHLTVLAERDIWARVEELDGKLRADDSAFTLADAVQEVTKWVTSNLLSNRWSGRSTSIVSNACELTLAEAGAKWLRSWAVVSCASNARV